MHVGIKSSWCFISDPSRIQEPGGRRELAALLGPVPHATERTAGHVLWGVTVPLRHASAVRCVSLVLLQMLEMLCSRCNTGPSPFRAGQS